MISFLPLPMLRAPVLRPSVLNMDLLLHGIGVIRQTYSPDYLAMSSQGAYCDTCENNTRIEHPTGCTTVMTTRVVSL
jgi:hypothetical protein